MKPASSVTCGATPTPAGLETGFSDVKATLKANVGEDVDDGDEAENEPVWKVTRGAAPTRAKLEAVPLR